MYEPGAKISSVVDNTKKRKSIPSENVQYEKRNKIQDNISDGLILHDLHRKMMEKLKQAKEAQAKTEDEFGFVDNPISIEEKCLQLKTKISQQVDNYIFYCSQKMNVQEDLDAKFGYGNQKYKSDSFNGKVQRELIGDDIKDAYYTYKYFDILEWWKNFGYKQWPELATAAAILIGKPTHNGFQERVFSRGTYKDCKLKQRLNEHSFEMSVLN
ncbi:MAG: hypothetical protein MUF12_09730, partial [Sediminibacterium sp.]|nr:hypothetical protein [Sediminibacterium sp.]